MIDFNEKKYYTPAELLEFINNDSTELSKVWAKKFPKYKEVVVLDQINRVVEQARKERKINFIKFKKNPSANRLFYGYTVKDVIDYLSKQKDSIVFDIELTEKE